MKPNTPLLFQKTPTFNSTPNAKYLRPMGVVQGEEVCEIEYRDQKWIVRESEVVDPDVAMINLAKAWRDKIAAAERGALPEKTQAAVARLLEISPLTVKRRREFIAKWLP